MLMEGNRKNMNAFYDQNNLKEIISLFKKITGQLFSLHSESTEDFDEVNQYLKDSYRIVNGFHEFCKPLIPCTDEMSLNNLRQLENICLQFKQFSLEHQHNLEFRKELMPSIEEAIPFIENCKKLLLNYKSTVSESIQDTTLNSLMLHMKNFGNTHNEICINLLSGLNYNKEICSLTEEFIKDISFFMDSISCILNKINQFIPHLQEKTTACNERIAVIITNLQYQDIINQRIEHIQHNHLEIINELEQFNQNFNNTQIHIKVKTFIRIRDITGLQAAQLIYANKQYRSAIDLIAVNIKNLNELLISINDLITGLPIT